MKSTLFFIIVFFFLALVAASSYTPDPFYTTRFEFRKSLVNK